MEALFAIRMGSIVSSCDGYIIPYVTRHGSFNHSYLTRISTKIGSQCKPFLSGTQDMKQFKAFQYHKLNHTAYNKTKLSANLYDIYHCCVYSDKLLMMDRGTARNM